MKRYEHESLLIKMEQLEAHEQFDELLETAVETCLRRPDKYQALVNQLPEREATDDNTKLVQELGLWGLRSVMDYDQFPSAYFRRSVRRHELGHDDLMREPHLFSATPEKSIQQKIEAFGIAILDEAFVCLGKDAIEKVAEFQAAESSEKQIQILNWLLFRVVEIRDHLEPDSIGTEPEEIDEEEKEQEEQEHFYHPARLSPKLIGEHPDTKLRPTCLGVSVLIASFLEKAGVDYMHSGVMATALEWGRLKQRISIIGIDNFVDSIGQQLPDYVNKKFEQIDKRTMNIFNNRGHHANINVRLRDKWCQLDPNYCSNVTLQEKASEEMDKCYKDLQDFNEYTYGAQRFVEVLEGHWASLYSHILDKVLDQEEELKISRDAFLQLLADPQPKEAIKMYLLSFVSTVNELNHTTEEYVKYTNQDKYTYIDQVLNDVIATYVFQDAKDGDISASIDRCHKDDAYLQRRIEDMTLAPLYVILRLQGDYLNYLSTYDPGIKLPVVAQEVGLPQYRVGACVLSDFAVYTGDELPFSFWATYFPSYAVLMDHFPDKDDEFSQELVTRLAKTITSAWLRYMNSYVIIEKLLEQKEDE